MEVWKAIRDENCELKKKMLVMKKPGSGSVLTFQARSGSGSGSVLILKMVPDPCETNTVRYLQIRNTDFNMTKFEIF